MAMFWAYTPEPDELEALAEAAEPATPGMDPRTRKNMLVGSFIFIQAEAHRGHTDRYVPPAVALACAGDQWVVDALCTPLPNRPALLHSAHDTCPVEDCLDPCLGDECICSDPASLAAANLRLCLSIIR